MSFWSRLFGGRRAEPPSPEQDLPTEVPPPQEPPPPDALQLLSQIGLQGGPSEPQILVALASLAHTPHESAALDVISSATLRGPLPEGVRIQCARILIDRGELPAASRFLSEASSIPALMMRADLLHGAGDVPAAVAVVERVLSRDIDIPGARERHTRWSSALSGAAPKLSRSRDETIAVPSHQQSPYRIVREVARGGAGVVYLAQDEPLGRPVALKLYHRPVEDAGQLRREATTATRFAGAGVLRVYDVDYDQGWLCLEWIEPGSLRDWLAVGRLGDLAPIAAWALPLAASLAILHAAGWVHADVKPANVLFRRPGRPVLGDFGIAAPAGTPASGGSAGFVSPERLAGRPLEPSDDIYGFGRILEEVVMRMPPNAQTASFAHLAERCMSPAGIRPPNATALCKLVQTASPRT